MNNIADTTYTQDKETIELLREALMDGNEWPTALLEAISHWAAPYETCQGREYTYFIGGEAFDWLLLAERLFRAMDDFVPEQEKEDLLFRARFPSYFDNSQFKALLGVDKYRGYLNYFYGVTVEEALHLAEEYAANKRHISNGNLYRKDFSEGVFIRIYQSQRSTLFKQFRKEMGIPTKRSSTLTETKEFTYWLFKHRLMVSDKAKIASDTRKGLQELQEITATTRPKAMF